MLVELGHLSLWLALCCSLAAASGILPFFSRSSLVIQLVPLLVIVSSFFTVFAFFSLATAFLNDDFSVALVVANSHVDLAWYYKLGAVWGNHEGSLLLWILILSLWNISLVSVSLPQQFRTRSLGFVAVLQAAFSAFSLFTSNPFTRLLPVPRTQGAELNPLLQDPAMMMHPPLLYVGYVGFAIPFAMAMAALSDNSTALSRDWARWARPWTLTAWSFLTIGIVLGSWWAYYELGWGGWWFWDPVENASLMPWLCGIALLHSLLVCQRRGLFQTWSLLLAISCFSLSLLGTFLVRSGVLVSVHAFAADPARGLYLLLFLVVTGSTGLVLIRRRLALLAVADNFRPLSRETALWLNNLLLITALLVVLCGTLFPLLMQALGRGVWSVGAPYFNTVILPLALIAMIVMAPAPALRWRDNAALPGHWQLWLVIAAVMAAVLPKLLGGSWHWLAAVSCFGISWLICYCLSTVRRQRMSVTIAHLGVAVCALGICFSGIYGISRDISLEAGDQALLGDYSFTLMDTRELRGNTYTATELTVAVADRRGQSLTVLRPQRRHYERREMFLSETDIALSWRGDLYVTAGEPHPGGAWTLRIQFKPLIRLIWLGGLMMALGGLWGPLQSVIRKIRLPG